jgi:hypothetical protein
MIVLLALAILEVLMLMHSTHTFAECVQQAFASDRSNVLLAAAVV